MMGTPTIITCPQNTWTKVLSNVTTGFIGLQNPRSQMHWQKCYVQTGGAAPTTLTQSIPVITPEITINLTNAIDVYLYPDCTGTVMVAT